MFSFSSLDTLTCILRRRTVSVFAFLIQIASADTDPRVSVIENRERPLLGFLYSNFDAIPSEGAAYRFQKFRGLVANSIKEDVRSTLIEFV